MVQLQKMGSPCAHASQGLRRSHSDKQAEVVGAWAVGGLQALQDEGVLHFLDKAKSTCECLSSSCAQPVAAVIAILGSLPLQTPANNSETTHVQNYTTPIKCKAAKQKSKLGCEAAWDLHAKSCLEFGIFGVFPQALHVVRWPWCGRGAALTELRSDLNKCLPLCEPCGSSHTMLPDFGASSAHWERALRESPKPKQAETRAVSQEGIKTPTEPEQQFG